MIVIVKFKALFLRTLQQFTAPDPWNNNQVTIFQIDEYVMMPIAFSKAVDTKQYAHRMGLRSQIAGVNHMIPESLVELWHENLIPMERMPSLAQAIEPRIIPEDCNITLHQSSPKALLISLIVVFVLLLFFASYATWSEGHFSPLLVIAISTLLTAFVGAIMWYSRQTGRRRRQQQMAWLLAAHAGTPVPALETRSRFKLKRFGMIYVMLLFAVLLMGGAVFLFQSHGRNASPSVTSLVTQQVTAATATGNIEMPVDMMGSNLATGARLLVNVAQTGESLKVRIPPGSHDGQRFRMRGRGAPTADGSRGDLFLKLHVVY